MDFKLSTSSQSLTRATCSFSIKSNEHTVVAVIGVGYVGEHLLEAFSSAFPVIGYDISTSRIEHLRSKHSKRTNVRFSTDEKDLQSASHFLICVPTPLGLNNSIDVSHVQNAVTMLYRHVSNKSIVVIESTVAIGMTRELLEPLARLRGIFAGMSPQRIDLGRVEPPLRSIPKVVSGLDDIVPGSLSAIESLYRAVFNTIISVSKPEVAEMSKLYENCQRTVAIAYANEMADACKDLGIDPFEVAQTSATKPFGYLPMYPSLGIGGHCIPVNPVYFMSTCRLPLLQQAHERMMARPSRIANQLLISILEDTHQKYGVTKRPKLLVVGLGFKVGQSDMSNSPGLQLLNFMRQSGEVDLMFCDPLPPLDYGLLDTLTDGYRMTHPRYSGSKVCLHNNGLACDGSGWPPGFNTSETSRPKIGEVPYGKSLHRCTVQGTLALTYDDGPSPWTHDLLDILKANNVKATFFVKTINLYEDLVNHRSDQKPAIIRRMYNEGHQVAGHTFAHKNLDNWQDRERMVDMTKMEMVLNDILGFFPTYMRPPFGQCGPACQKQMGELGYHVISWDMNPRDWQGNYTYAEEVFVEKIQKNNSQNKKAWLNVAHDTQNRTVYTFTQFMINKAREYGYELVTVGECMNDPEENWYRDPLSGNRPLILPPKEVI
ncbi:vi polysaccharide biosynthesis protein vipA/tviB [Bipolaris maydis]|nr:vi polysaccharide biosynthesis protein vipA/tviB [Bipolaris maydis]KAJ6193170.1 vi polysaccharide biosynthesis protein vipA/tviB [Bipolaris maydis]